MVTAAFHARVTAVQISDLAADHGSVWKIGPGFTRCKTVYRERILWFELAAMIKWFTPRMEWRKRTTTKYCIKCV